MVKILDCTTRDGGHSTNWEFSDDFVNNHIAKLQKSNVDFYEIGYRNRFDNNGKGRFFYCTKELLRIFCRAKNNLKIGIMTDVSRFSIEDFENAKNDYVDFVRIASHPDRIKDMLDIASKLHNRGYNVIPQIMEIPNVKEKHYEILADYDKKSNFECIYIADTYSKVQPKDIEQYFNILKEIGYINIGFHAHNKHGLALENTLKAIELGVYSVDVTYQGLGDNLDIEKLFEKLS